MDYLSLITDMSPGQVVQRLTPTGHCEAVIVGGGSREQEAFFTRYTALRALVWSQRDVEAQLGPSTSIHTALEWIRQKKEGVAKPGQPSR